MEFTHLRQQLKFTENFYIWGIGIVARSRYFRSVALAHCRPLQDRHSPSRLAPQIPEAAGLLLLSIQADAFYTPQAQKRMKSWDSPLIPVPAHSFPFPQP